MPPVAAVLLVAVFGASTLAPLSSVASAGMNHPVGPYGLSTPPDRAGIGREGWASSAGAPHVRMTTTPELNAMGPAYPTGTPTWLAFDPNDDSFWVAVDPSSVDVIPASATNNVTTVVPVGTAPFGVAVDNVTGLVFVTNTGSDNVTVISDSTDLPVASYSVGGSPSGIAVDPSSGEVYVANSATDNVSVISESQAKVVANIPVGREPVGVAFDPASGRVFVANRDGYTLSAISASSNTVVATIAVGVEPYGVAIDNVTDNVYVTDEGSNNLSVVHATSGAVVASIPVSAPLVPYASQLQGIAFDPRTGQMWVGDGYWYLILINTTTESVGAVLSIDPSGVAWDGPDQMMCLTNTYNSTFTCLTQTPQFGYPGKISVHATGLPTGTPWRVGLDNGSAWTPSNASRQDLAVGGGSIILVVPPAGGYLPNVSEFQFVVPANGVPVRVNVSFAPSPYLYRLQFNETGLPTGTGWTVRVAGLLEFSSSAGSAAATVPNGTYYYVVDPIDGYAPTVDHGTVQVLGANAYVTIDYAVSTSFGIGFSESGLPNGTAWYLNATAAPSGAPLVSSGPITSASGLLGGLENGTYAVSVQTADRRYQTAPAIHFTCDDGRPIPANVTSILFTEVTQSLVFRAAGLPLHDLWAVTVAGQVRNSSTASIAFTEPNGSFEYSVTAPLGFVALPASGIVRVNGPSAAPVPINFTSTATYAIGFQETGLPNGTGWAVAIGSQLESSTTSTVTLLEPNGTFNFVIVAVSGFRTNSSGTVVVNAVNVTESITFVPQDYPVVIVEFGLPPGTNWSATITDPAQGINVTHSTNGSALLFFLPNGTYTLTVSVPPGFTANVTSATFTVAGKVASTSPTIGFSPASLSRGPTRHHPSPSGWGSFSPWLWPGLIAAVALAVIGTGLLLARRGGPSGGAPVGPLPPDPSFPSPASSTERGRELRRTNGDGPAEPLDDVF